MKLRNLRLTLANIASNTSARSLPVNELGVIKERGEDGKPIPDRIIGYSVTCAARRDTITIKFSSTVKEEWEKLKELIDNDIYTEISFEGLVLTAYSLKSASGDIVSGVSAKAQSFRIVKNEKDDLFGEIPDEEVNFN